MAIGQGVRRSFAAALIALAATAVAVLVWATGILGPFEQKTWDMREQALAKPGPASGEIALIMLDQPSLDWGKKVNQLSWPWPRQVYSYIINFAKRSGAKSIAFDVLFTEPSKYGVFDDESLGESIASSGNFVAAVPLGDPTGSDHSWPDGAPAPRLTVAGLDRWLPPSARTASARTHFLVFQSGAFPIPEVSSKAAMIANVTLSPDQDGVYRRGALFSLFDGKVVPSLALAAYLAGNPGNHHLAIRRGLLTVDGVRVPIAADGAAYLRYRGPSQTYTTVSAAAVIQSEIQVESGEKPTIDPSTFKDKYVIFGFSAPGLLDLRPAPTAGTYTGMEVHATMLDNLLSGDFVRTIPAPWVVLIALVIALAAASSIYAFSSSLSNIVTYVIALPTPAALGLLAYAWGGRFPIIMTELAVVLSLIGAGIAKYVTEGRQKRYIKGAFKQYLSPAVIEALILHPDRLKLGGERRELSIFFSDLQGFTTISEGLSPEDLTALLNEYLSAMTDIIQDEGGTIDKYEGDAIIAFWNAPIEQTDHAVRAVRAALRCQARLVEMRPAFNARVGKNLYKRIGINTGPAVVGNMGSATRFDYTMLGDAVNLASRLEGVNKQFRTYTMISGMTLAALADAFPVRELSRIAVVGRKEPVTVYEPMTPEEYEARKGDFETFASGLREFYAGKFEAAIGQFETTADRDPAAAAYRDKCRALSAQPPQSWEGVWVMTEK